ncbi:MAG: ADP-ribosylation factor-like protein [Promethearchaeota archaeon]
MSEELLVLSYFDEIYGPSIFYCNVPSLNDPDYPNLTRVLDFNDDEGTFIFAFRKYQSLNHLFYNETELARGGKDLLMISYMVKSAYFRNEIVDVFKYLDSKRKVLINFSLELKKMKQLPKILREKKRDANKLNELNFRDKKFENKFLKLYNEYFDVISYKQFERTIGVDHEFSKKIFILGTPHSGKTSFLKNIEDSQFYMQNNPGLPTQIYELVIDNLAILSYDCFEQKLQCSQCEHLGGCLENAQGFVVVFDVTDENSILSAKEHFQSIINSCGLIESDKIPVLIIGNKRAESDEFDDDYILKIFEFENLESCGMKMKYFKLNIEKEGKNLLKSLRWMIKHML